MEYNRSDIRNIAFEPINDRFSKGKYLGIEVTMDMTNGYINGNHLVGQVLTSGGQPKEFKSWKRSKEAIDIIEYLTVQICTVKYSIISIASLLRFQLLNSLGCPPDVNT